MKGVLIRGGSNLKIYSTCLNSLLGKYKIKNKPKHIPDLESKLWVMLESNFYANKASVKNLCIKSNQMTK